MNDPTRRSVLLGGATAAAGLATVIAGASAAGTAAAATSGLYIWAINTTGVVVPHATWTRITWPQVVLNTTTAHLDPDGATWIVPTSTASGIFGILCNIAWDNSLSPTGAPIAPPTHRKLARMPQQNVGTPQNSIYAITAASSELLYHSDLASRNDQATLSDGSKGYQQQQLYIQAGFVPTLPDQRFWIEVYQDSGQPLMCRWDGTSAPGTSTRPAMIGLQAPSLMWAKLVDW